MISVFITIEETDDSSGDRRPILINRLRSLNEDFVAGGVQSQKIKMLPEKDIKLSSIVGDDLDNVTSVTILSQTDDDNIHPLFDVSMLDNNGAPLSTQRCSQYSVCGLQGLENDIQINNMAGVDGNPNLVIIITTND